MSFLSEASLFQDLDPELLQAMERRFVTKHYKRNTIVIEQGDESRAFFIIVSGRVRIYVADDQGKEAIINELGPGACFGELAMLTRAPRSASAITLQDTQLKSINEATFRELLESESGFALKLVERLARRVVALTEEVSSLALCDVYGRVRSVLRKMAVPGQDGTAAIPQVTQQEIASRVGSSREMVSRIFKDLKQGDYIRIEGRSIHLLKDLPERW